MSHGDLEVPPEPRTPDVPASGLRWRLVHVLRNVNLVLDYLGGAALIAASVVLTWSVVSRYFLKSNTDWQDEVAVFCIVGAVFMSGASVQSFRGHIGIEAVAVLMSERANRIRNAIVDVASFLFCAFFSWKSWTLWHEAWRDNQTTSSSFAPPLWIPYGLMAAGMTLLTLMLALQVWQHYDRMRGRE